MKYRIGDEIGYHGRSGKIISLEPYSAIVYFADMDEEKDIEFDELDQQNESKKKKSESYISSLANNASDLLNQVKDTSSSLGITDFDAFVIFVMKDKQLRQELGVNDIGNSIDKLQGYWGEILSGTFEIIAGEGYTRDGKLKHRTNS